MKKHGLGLVTPMVQAAIDGGYAIGYFESWDVASLQGVLDAAEQTRSPVIIGCNGEFLSGDVRERRERLGIYAGMLAAAARSTTVSCATIFNECPQRDWLMDATAAGFDIVMPAAGEENYGSYIKLTTDIVTIAHKAGVAVEAELGELPSGAEGSIDNSHAQSTDPDTAADFVDQTGVDLLAVSVGNVHILTDGRRELDIALLDSIRDRVGVPLVLHGGTGIDPDSLATAVGHGVAKVNYGTGLKLAWLAAARRVLGTTFTNPHRVLGMGGTEDFFEATRDAVRQAVLRHLPALGCMGRA